MVENVLTRDTRKELLSAWERLDVPAGWRAEIHDGEIVMIPGRLTEFSEVVNRIV